MANFERRTIRINGKPVNSPRFTGKDAKRLAREWYAEKLKEKDFIEKGLLSSNVPTFMAYAAKWIRARIERYPKATWSSDEQRLRDYLLPALSEFPMDKITRTQMREVLTRAQAKNKLSITTRTAIKVLASKIFNDAMNENPPLAAFNPCANLSFSDPRQGIKTPETLEDDQEVRDFLAAAKGVGRTEFIACAIALMSGLRKSEMIPLRYRNVRRKGTPSITVEARVEQASNSILPGTKAGRLEPRTVYVSDELIALIDSHRRGAKFDGSDDFIMCDKRGDWIRPRMLHKMIDRVLKVYGRRITLHKLRHSYGRLAVTKGMPQKALQAQLGHSSSSTTDLYSKLAGSQVAPFGKLMSYAEKPASDLESESKTTPNRHQQKTDHEEYQEDSYVLPKT